MRLNRISVKLLLVVAAVLAVQAGVRGYLDSAEEADRAWKNFVAGGRVHAVSVAQAAEYGLLTRDAAELKKVAAMLRAPDDVDLQYVAFYDETGAILASTVWGEEASVPARTDPVHETAVVRCDEPGHAGVEHYRFCVPVKVSRAMLGQGDPTVASAATPGTETALVVASRTYENAKARIAKDQGRSVLMSGLIFAGAMVLLMVFSYRLTRPIEMLARATRRVAEGDLATRVSVGRRRDELRALADSFNRMTGQLQEQREQILAHSRELEQKVTDRTSELNTANAQLRDVNVRLEELAITDELTGLWNRRRLVEMLERECQRVKRQGTKLALAMIDVDHFKTINDTHGHAFGDRVLVETAELLRSKARATDIVARYAGDEFMILMPDTSAEEAFNAATRFRSQMRECTITDGKHSVQITLSVGISAADPSVPATPENLIRLADEALYASKNAGRDTVRTWTQIRRDQQDDVAAQTPEIENLQRRMASLSLQAKDVFVQSIQGLVHALEARDTYSRSHSDNVTLYAVGIAETMSLPPEDVAVIRRAAMVHDVGKIGVPDAILRKRGPLTPGERRVMQQHPLIGVRILEQLRFLDREVPLVRHHHERWDGGGYPDGIAGQAVPLGARILAVADAFDATTSDRVYRKAAELPDALRILIQESGRQFDPDIVDALIRWVQATGRAIGKPGDVATADMLARRSE